MFSVKPSTGALLSAFEQHYAELVRYIARRTGSLEDARGLAHDTWVRIAERDAGNDIVLADPKAYLFSISHSVAMNHLQRGNWLKSYLAECEQTAGAAPSHAPDVADSAMYRQAVSCVDAALISIPDRARTVYLAHGLHGEKQCDIAERMGVSIDTVKRDIALAASQIEQALQTWRETHPTASYADAPGTKASAARSKRTGRRKSLGALLGIVAAGLSATALWQHLQREALRFQTTLATLRGRVQQHVLPDGSAITLDAQTRIDVDFSPERRWVSLQQGAAFFAVQRDVSRPFVVQALGLEVTVLGTRFGVEIDGGNAVIVQVESGAVRVDADGQRTELRGGQSLRVQEGRQLLTAVSAPASWRAGILVFDDMPLADAVARIERYSPVALRVSPSAGALTISGKVQVADAGGWLASLPSVLPVRIRKQADGSIHLERR